MKRFFDKARLLALASLIIASLTGVLPSQSASRGFSRNHISIDDSSLFSARETSLGNRPHESDNPSLRLLPVDESIKPGCLSANQVNICKIVKTASPSIVLIRATGIERDDSGTPTVSKSIGSGFFIDSDLIITNNHVVENAPIVTVELADGQKIIADVLIRSESRDLAIIRINRQYAPLNSLPPPLALRSEEPQVGELSIALGHPRGLEYVVATFGRVSATGITASALGKEATDRKTYIQTDTAINPGNSGGPLLDASGKVIGVNAAILKDSEGIAFILENRHILWLLKQLGEKKERRGLVN